MTKKRFKITIAILLLLLSFALVACKDDGTGKGHVTLTFITNCAYSIDPIVLDGETEKVMPDNPIRAGYIFAGWYYDQLFTTRFTVKDAITKDTTLYARWTVNPMEPEIPEIPPEDAKGVKYEVAEDNNGESYYIVRGYEGDGVQLRIPDRYNSRPVTEIGEKAFFNHKTLESIHLGLDIEIIGKDAFRGCEVLQKIVVEEGSYFFRSVDGLLFNNTPSDGSTTLIAAPAGSTLDVVTLPKETVNILDYAMDGCKFELKFAQNSKYERIEGRDFGGFDGKYVIDAKIKNILQYAFYDATADITFASDNPMTELTMGAFDSFKGQSLVLTNNITAIANGAFASCSAIVDLSKTSLQVLGSNAFSHYIGKTLTIPAGVHTIEKNAFVNSTTSITFETGSVYATVKELAFSYFDGKVQFPFTVSAVGKSAFHGAHAEVRFPMKQTDFASGSLHADFVSQFKGKMFFDGVEVIFKTLSI